MRLERAERVGLTYEEYTLEMLERGRHLGDRGHGTRRRDKGSAPQKALRSIGAAARWSTERRKFCIDLPGGRTLWFAAMKKALILVVGRRMGKAV